MNEEAKTAASTNFTVAQIGTFDKLNSYKFSHQKLPFDVLAQQSSPEHQV
jgi:hypothetical protein